MKAEHPTARSMRWITYCKITNKTCNECEKGRITEQTMKSTVRGDT